MDQEIATIRAVYDGSLYRVRWAIPATARSLGLRSMGGTESAHEDGTLGTVEGCRIISGLMARAELLAGIGIARQWVVVQEGMF